MATLHSVSSLTREQLRLVHDEQERTRPGAPRRAWRWIVDRLIRRQERVLEAPLDYLRDIGTSSPAALFKLALIAPLGEHRRHLPLEAWHVARVAATFAEDCGTCAQIAIALARRDRVSSAVLRAVIAHEPARLPEPLRDTVAFVRAVIERREDPQLRERVRTHFGENGVIELGLVIAVSRFIPGLKRALGHAQSCALLRFELPAA